MEKTISFSDKEILSEAIFLLRIPKKWWTAFRHLFWLHFPRDWDLYDHISSICNLFNSNKNHHAGVRKRAVLLYRQDTVDVSPSIPIGIPNENDACMGFA
jgi:hypothetical protein